MKLPPMKYIKLPQPEIKPINFDETVWSFTSKLGAYVTDVTDKAIIDAIIKYATEQGFSDLYLIDEEFIKSAIIHEIQRRETMELKRDEIIKALECCNKDDCDNCPNTFGNCYSNLAGYALSLIKELTEENERLKASCSYLKPIRAFTEEEMEQTIKESLVRADTVREMQEKVYEVAHDVNGIDAYWITSMIDQIAEEMIGGEG